MKLICISLSVRSSSNLNLRMYFDCINNIIIIIKNILCFPFETNYMLVKSSKPNVLSDSLKGCGLDASQNGVSGKRCGGEKGGGGGGGGASIKLISRGAKTYFRDACWIFFFNRHKICRAQCLKCEHVGKFKGQEVTALTSGRVRSHRIIFHYQNIKQINFIFIFFLKSKSNDESSL